MKRKKTATIELLQSSKQSKTQRPRVQEIVPISADDIRRAKQMKYGTKRHSSTSSDTLKAMSFKRKKAEGKGCMHPKVSHGWSSFVEDGEASKTTNKPAPTWEASSRKEGDVAESFEAKSSTSFKSDPGVALPKRKVGWGPSKNRSPLQSQSSVPSTAIKKTPQHSRFGWGKSTADFQHPTAVTAPRQSSKSSQIAAEWTTSRPSTARSTATQSTPARQSNKSARSGFGWGRSGSTSASGNIAATLTDNAASASSAAAVSNPPKSSSSRTSAKTRSFGWRASEPSSQPGSDEKVSPANRSKVSSAHSSPSRAHDERSLRTSTSRKAEEVDAKRVAFGWKSAPSTTNATNAPSGSTKPAAGFGWKPNTSVVPSARVIDQSVPSVHKEGRSFGWNAAAIPRSSSARPSLSPEEGSRRGIAREHASDDRGASPASSRWTSTSVSASDSTKSSSSTSTTRIGQSSTSFSTSVISPASTNRNVARFGWKANANAAVQPSAQESCGGLEHPPPTHYSVKNNKATKKNFAGMDPISPASLASKYSQEANYPKHDSGSALSVTPKKHAASHQVISPSGPLHSVASKAEPSVAVGGNSKRIVPTDPRTARKERHAHAAKETYDPASTSASGQQQQQPQQQDSLASDLKSPSHQSSMTSISVPQDAEKQVEISEEAQKFAARFFEDLEGRCNVQEEQCRLKSDRHDAVCGSNDEINTDSTKKLTGKNTSLSYLSPANVPPPLF